jgi:hypothetical protein
VQIAGKEGDTPCGGTIDGNVTYYSSSGSSGPPPARAYMCDVKDSLYCPTSTSTGPAPKCTRMAAVGAACDTGSQYSCVKDAYCDFSSKTCMANAAIGAACDFGVKCVTGAYCDSTAKKCAATLADGSDCTSSEQCASDNCNNKKCQKSNTLGDAFLCGGN